MSKAKPSDEALAWACLRGLRDKPPIKSVEFLNLWEESFRSGNDVSVEKLQEGMMRFYQMANMSPDKKRTEMGHKYMGFNYANDIVDDWNATTEEKAKVFTISSFSPTQWACRIQAGGLNTLVYAGDRPANALLDLVRGPSIIDCAQYTQLAFLFGVLFMVGEQSFNQLFGRQPLILSRNCFSEITDPLRPDMGNPLLEFFLKEQPDTPTVQMVYVENNADYGMRHPGGDYSGENCFGVNDHLFILDPASFGKNSNGMTLLAVCHLLVEADKKPQSDRDRDIIELWRNSAEIHPTLKIPFGIVASLAESVITQDAPPLPVMRDTRYFDFKKMEDWIGRMLRSEDTVLEAMPGPTLTVSTAAANLPQENREATFQNVIPKPFQAKMFAAGVRFSKEIIAGHPAFLVLEGSPGTGKSTVAACCYDELHRAEKKVHWVSGTHRANTSGSTLEENQTASLLFEASLQKTDVVIMDDSYNREEIEIVFKWYAKNPSKGIIFTTNAFERELMFGPKLSGEHPIFPFLKYTSFHFQNLVHLTITGESQRKSISGAVTNEVAFAGERTEGQSFGRILSIAQFRELKSALPTQVFSHAIGKGPVVFRVHTDVYGRPSYQTKQQLMSLILAAHECAGSRIILINETGLNDKAFEKAVIDVAGDPDFRVKNPDLRANRAAGIVSRVCVMFGFLADL